MDKIEEERLGVREELDAKMRLMGNREFIDIFTFAPDPRSTNEILDRVPKCCIGQPPPPTMEELAEKYKLKPATERDTSRPKQKHQQRI